MARVGEEGAGERGSGVVSEGTGFGGGLEEPFDGLWAWHVGVRAEADSAGAPGGPACLTPCSSSCSSSCSIFGRLADPASEGIEHEDEHEKTFESARRPGVTR